MVKVMMTPAEFDAILTGLVILAERMHKELSEDDLAVMTNCGRHKALTRDEVVHLLTLLNCGEL